MRLSLSSTTCQYTLLHPLWLASAIFWLWQMCESLPIDVVDGAVCRIYRVQYGYQMIAMHLSQQPSSCHLYFRPVLMDSQSVR